MNPQQLQAQAQQAAQQGQQQLASDNSQAAASTNAYNQQSAQAGQANQNLQNYTQYMQGAGSGTNLYNQGLSSAQQMYGFDPKALATATQNLTQSQNAQSALNQASQSSTGGYGLSGAQLGGYYASASQPLANQVGAQSTAVGNLTNLANTTQTQANQVAGAGLQGEQTTSGALNNVFQNSQAQAAQSATLMQQYAALAQSQGGLNAEEQANYNAAINSYQQAKAAVAAAAASYASANQSNAQAGLLGQQTIGAQQANAVGAQNAAYAKTAATPGSFGVLAPNSGAGLSLQGTMG